MENGHGKSLLGNGQFYLKSVLELWKILVGEWAILFEKCP
jgi:hypothetical protein